MTKLLFLCCSLLISLLINDKLYAQSSSWGEFEELYADNQIKVEIQFKIRKNGCKQQKTCKYRYRLTGELHRNTKYVYWQIKYKDYDGNVITSENQLPISIENYNDSKTKDGEYGESMDYRFMAKNVVKKFYNVRDNQQNHTPQPQITPDDGTDYFALGKKRYKQEKYAQALKAFLKADKKDNIENYSYVVSCYRQLNQPRKVIRYVHRKTKSCCKDWSMKQLMYLHSDLNQYDSAYFYAHQTIHTEPDNYLNWFNLSFYALFKGKYYEAIEAAEKTLRLNSKARGVETNLALGYLLTNRWSKAQKIYQKWNNKRFPNDKRTADEVFLKDIADLEQAGIRHPDFDRVRRLLQN